MFTNDLDIGRIILYSDFQCTQIMYQMLLLGQHALRAADAYLLDIILCEQRVQR